MKKIAILLALVLVSSLLMVSLSSCGSNKVKLNVYNWGEYIADGSDDSMKVIAEFEKANPDIDVVYSTFATNEEMYAKLKSGSAKYDVIIPSDYMISRMIEEDMLQKIDLDSISNFKNISESFVNPQYDPTNEYSVPYTWGTVGIIYNTTMVDETVDSWDILWNEKYKDNILMFNNSRDAFGIALKKLGYSQNTTDVKQLDEAAELLRQQKPLIQAYVMDEIFDKMVIGEAAIGVYYAGDALTMMDDNEDLAFVVPKEGSNKFVDAMVIPKTSTKAEYAQRFIDFMLSDEIALENISFIGYSTPLDTVRELLDPELKDSLVAYPTDEVLAKCDSFINLPSETNEYVQDLWVDIISSKGN